MVVWGLKHSLLKKLDSLVVCMYKIVAVIGEKFDVDLRKQNVFFWARMSDEGVGGDTYSPEGMRKKDSSIVVCARFW